MARHIAYEVSINDERAKNQSYSFSLAVPDDMSDADIENEVKRHAMAHAVNMVWRKLDFIGPKKT